MQKLFRRTKFDDDKVAPKPDTTTQPKEKWIKMNENVNRWSKYTTIVDASERYQHLSELKRWKKYKLEVKI